MPDNSDYPEADSGTASNTAQADVENPGEDKGEGDEGQETALLPKSLFGGDCKVGDEYKVKVVGVLEDELEVEPIKESKPESGGKSRMAMAGDKLDSMNGEYGA